MPIFLHNFIQISEAGDNYKQIPESYLVMPSVVQFADFLQIETKLSSTFVLSVSLSVVEQLN